MKIKKGDNVIVIKGKDKGKSGKVILADRENAKVVVEGVNMKKKHTKAKQGIPGTMFDKAMPMSVSNVAIIDPKDNRPARISKKEVGGRMVRVAHRSGSQI